MDLQPLNHIELLLPLGETHMSSVYEARDNQLNRTVAVKLLHTKRTDSRSTERFIREAQIAAGLSHPNIVGIHAIGLIDDQIAIVMEYLGGGTLNEQNMTTESAVALALQITSALDHAHLANLVHRDIKPQNILFDSQGTPKLVDFGIAKAFGMTQLTADRTFLGTPQYASPEQAKGEPLDHRSDLYSLGVVLYELISGHPPFESDDPLALLYQHVHEDPPALNTDPDLADIVATLLQKQPEKRFQTARELAARLKAWPTAPPPPPIYPPTRRTFPIRARIRVALIIVAILMIPTYFVVSQRKPKSVPDTISMVPRDEPAGIKTLIQAIEFRPIPGGAFTMGTRVHRDHDARETHEVALSPFRMSATEITQEVWQAVMQNNPSCQKGHALPVENVSYKEVMIFIEKLNAIGVGTYRLPTEAEWEYRCRAGDRGSGDVFRRTKSIMTEAWFSDNAGQKSHPVGELAANHWGLYDMRGNVWEWCSDWYDANYYERSPFENPHGPDSGSARVVRGGAFNSPETDCRATNRFKWNPDESSCRIGFRLVRVD
ncbi:MAG: SUMF1/EgtB/PvdO family nonheme iron enzyme [Acidobacteria bacterium]|nr:SUMF1/EgtB/PvdO family nonheme iron enzyme [Acidobacteriota bacterium]